MAVLILANHEVFGLIRMIQKYITEMSLIYVPIFRNIYKIGTIYAKVSTRSRHQLCHAPNPVQWTRDADKRPYTYKVEAE